MTAPTSFLPKNRVERKLQGPPLCLSTHIERLHPPNYIHATFSYVGEEQPREREREREGGANARIAGVATHIYSREELLQSYDMGVAMMESSRDHSEMRKGDVKARACVAYYIGMGWSCRWWCPAAREVWLAAVRRG